MGQSPGIAQKRGTRGFSHPPQKLSPHRHRQATPGGNLVPRDPCLPSGHICSGQGGARTPGWLKRAFSQSYSISGWVRLRHKVHTQSPLQRQVRPCEASARVLTPSHVPPFETGLGWGWHEKLKSPALPYREWLPSSRLERNSVNSELENPEKQELARGWEKHQRDKSAQERAGNRGELGTEEKGKHPPVCVQKKHREPLSHRPAVYAGQRGRKSPPKGALWATAWNNLP